MRLLLFLAVVFAVATVVSAYPGEFGTPATPQNLQTNSAYDHYDVQIHNRDRFSVWDQTTAAQHGAACQGPPATHALVNLADSVYICNDHVMTSMWAEGYGEALITPSQVMNCSTGCSVQFNMSTERMSTRDWPDMWLTPWDDNLAVPIEQFLPDLQGPPKRTLHIGSQANNNSWAATIFDDYQPIYFFNPSYITMNYGIQAGTNQAAVRQTFKLTVTPGHIKFERLASATASALVFIDEDAPVYMAPDYVVSFAQHSYNPTKEGAGIAATWHWSDFNLSNATPFTLIHTSPALVTANNSLVTFNAPAPANAYLRFSGVCKIMLNGALASPQKPTAFFEHANSYFVPIAQGLQSVTVSFAPDGWYGGPCAAQDFHVWSKQGGPPSTPTPIPSTATPQATSTSTPTVVLPTPLPPTPTPSPTSTATAVPPTPTSTPTVVPPTPTPQAMLCYKSVDNGLTINRLPIGTVC